MASRKSGRGAHLSRQFAGMSVDGPGPRRSDTDTGTGTGIGTVTRGRGGLRRGAPRTTGTFQAGGRSVSAENSGATVTSGSSVEKDKEGEEQEKWYNQPRSSHPYELVAISSDTGPATTHTWHQAVYFPWPVGSRPSWVDTSLPSRRAAWMEKQRTWAQVVALCGGDEVRLVETSRKEPYKVLHSLKLDQVPGEARRPRKKADDGSAYPLGDRARALTWAADPEDLSLFLCFAGSGRLIYVWDVERKKYRSCLRGHGQTIMHLTTHPSYPYIIASSARDRSTRIYDITLPQSFNITYAPLADGMPNRGNFPMGGIPVTRDGKEGVEGDGPGKGIIVLGWYVEGHRDAVVGADFHPTLPLLATCGLDNAVRIWALPKLPVPKNKPWEMCAIADPLFGTRLLHSSALDSIFWLAEDTLVSKSWDEHAEGSRTSSIVVWQWTELDRFFPLSPTSRTGREERYWERNRVVFEARSLDGDNSRLYRELVRFKDVPHTQYTRLAAGTVEHLLLAWGSTSRTGTITLINPLLRDPKQKASEPPVIKNEMDGEEAEVEVYLSGNPKQVLPTKPAREEGWKLTDAAFGKMARAVPGLRERARNPGELFEGERHGEKEKQEGDGITLHTIAIRPRGARYIVGAGEFGVILVWRMETP